ncbi:MAG: 2-phospho-L-lactate guanylyltransferase [Chloroflexi bacterium]|nr:2-phospho-L-lactate guanylyltransferase [Chloroflexota bacterium]
MSVWAVVPIRALWGGKSRLAPLLEPAERAALSACLLGGVLRALRAVPALARIVVISPDATVRALVEPLGAEALPDPAPAHCADEDHGSLNAALDHASTRAAAAGASSVLVLPADLPLARPDDIHAVLMALPPPPSVVLVPTADGGTGALLRMPPAAIPACFGPDSAARHLAAARARGVRARIVWRPRLALDCDEPRDLLRLVDAPASADLRALLTAWRLPARTTARVGLAGGEP